MRHGRTVRKLGRTAAHRRAMLGNMATALFRAHALVTTAARARVLRATAERLITLGKRGDLHARRLAAERVHDKAVLKKLFEEIAPQFASRSGGYTRIIKVGTRRGDGAALARVELVMPKAVVQTDQKGTKKAARKVKEEPAPAAKGEKGKKSSKDRAKAAPEG